MTAFVVRADARALPVPDNTVDLVVTSPPYFALRSYQDGGEHYAGQIGDEPTPSEFVEALLEVTRECIRVLKPTGSLWVNLGDKYATYAGNRSSGRTTLQDATDRSRPIVPRKAGLDGGGEVRSKSLMGIPWRYALRCIDDFGLVLRAEVVWSKPNGLPESVVDRVRRSHEQWFHFTLEPRYYSAVDHIREPYQWAPTPGYKGPPGRAIPGQPEHHFDGELQGNVLGKLPGSVWVVPTEPLVVPDHIAHGRCCAGVKRADCEDGIDHYAAFPTEWPKRIIQAWSPASVCTACGDGRRPIVSATYDTQGRTTNGPKNDVRMSLCGPSDSVAGMRSGIRSVRTTTIDGETCGCPDASAPSTPSVVLDPFGGTGTTAMVASVLGRVGITVDRSADYCHIARWRTTDRNQRAKVLGLPPVQQQPVTQDALW